MCVSISTVVEERKTNARNGREQKKKGGGNDEFSRAGTDIVSALIYVDRLLFLSFSITHIWSSSSSSSVVGRPSLPHDGTARPAASSFSFPSDFLFLFFFFF